MPPSRIRVIWERRAFKELMALPKEGRRLIVAVVEELPADPLKGGLLSGEWKGLRRLRVGNYRVIYAFDGERLLIAVIRVAHRREAYR